jgi:hypothetical protein
MTPALLTITALIYLAVAVNFALNGKPGLGVAFGAYAVANLGLLWEGL